jgi:hypothetical protein
MFLHFKYVLVRLFQVELIKNKNIISITKQNLVNISVNSWHIPVYYVVQTKSNLTIQDVTKKYEIHFDVLTFGILQLKLQKEITNLPENWCYKKCKLRQWQ